MKQDQKAKMIEGMLAAINRDVPSTSEVAAIMASVIAEAKKSIDSMRSDIAVSSSEVEAMRLMVDRASEEISSRLLSVASSASVEVKRSDSALREIIAAEVSELSRRISDILPFDPSKIVGDIESGDARLDGRIDSVDARVTELDARVTSEVTELEEAIAEAVSEAKKTTGATRFFGGPAGNLQTVTDRGNATTTSVTIGQEVTAGESLTTATPDITVVDGVDTFPTEIGNYLRSDYHGIELRYDFRTYTELYGQRFYSPNPSAFCFNESIGTLNQEESGSCSESYDATSAYTAGGSNYEIHVIPYKTVDGIKYRTVEYGIAYDDSSSGDPIALNWIWGEAAGADGYLVVITNNPILGVPLYKLFEGVANTSFYDIGDGAGFSSTDPELPWFAATFAVDLSWTLPPGVTGTRIIRTDPVTLEVTSIDIPSPTATYRDGNTIIGTNVTVTPTIGYNATHTMRGQVSLDSIEFPSGYPSLTAAGIPYFEFAANSGIGIGEAVTGTEGNINIGSGSMTGNLAQAARGNISVGYNNMGITSGQDNVAMGTNALSIVGDGMRNVAIGKGAALSQNFGDDSVAIGTNAGKSMRGYSNVCIGNNSSAQGVSLRIGGNAIIIGSDTLPNSSAFSCVAIGTDIAAVASQVSSSQLIGNTVAAGAGSIINSIAIGNQAMPTVGDAFTATVIGFQAGKGMSKKAHRVTAIGNYSTCHKENAITLGAVRADAFAGDIGLRGIAFPTQSVHADGNYLATDTSSKGTQRLNNPGFVGTGSWTLGTGWSFASGIATYSFSNGGSLVQTSANMALPLIEGEIYLLTVDMLNYASGSMTISVGTSFSAPVGGSALSGNNTYTYAFVANGPGDLTFSPAGGASETFSISNVQINRLTGGGYIAAGPSQMLGGMRYRYEAKTANYTLADTDHVINCTSGTFALTLPTAAGRAGKEFILKNSGTGVITMNTTSSQTIDGVASGVLTLAQWDSLTVIGNGANWIII